MNPETMTLVGWSVAALLAGGPGCEEVAGQVESREDGELKEAVLLSRTRDAGTDAGTRTR